MEAFHSFGSTIRDVVSSKRFEDQYNTTAFRITLLSKFASGNTPRQYSCSSIVWISFCIPIPSQNLFLLSGTLLSGLSCEWHFINLNKIRYVTIQIDCFNQSATMPHNLGRQVSI